MTNITHEVWKILDNNPSLRQEMKRGLINISALAKYIITEKKVDTTIDAVISAIRRYKLDKHDDIFNNAYKILGQTVNLSSKSNLAEITLVKDDDVQQLLPKLFSIIKYIRGDVLRIFQANESIRILIDEKNIDNVMKIFPKSKIITKEKNLAEINCNVNPKMQTTPGILATIANEIALNEINIVEFMTCTPELICVIKKDDLLKTSNVLYKLCEGEKVIEDI
jgi:aspartokinase